MFHSKLVKVVIALAALSLLASAAYAAIPSANGTISACKDSKGALKVIDADAGQTCNANQQLLTWGQQGPQGLPGPQGPAGQDGVSGRQIAYAVTGSDSEAHKSQVAACPSGKMPVGGGAVVGTQSGPSWITPEGVALTASYATGNLWAAAAHEIVPTDQHWQLVVYAICVTTT